MKSIDAMTQGSAGAADSVRAGRYRARRRLRALAVMVSAPVLAGLVAVPAASAEPVASDPVTASMEQIGDLGYAALFHAGLQIYELAQVRPFDGEDPQPDEPQELVLRRLHSADEGVPGAPRYAFVGEALPEAFAIAEGWPGIPTGTFGAVDPVTLEELPVPWSKQMVSSITRDPIGPFTSIGIVTRYLG